MRDDWVECALGEIFFTTSGGTPSRKNKAHYEGSIPWVKSGELDKGIIFDTEEKITEEAIKNSSAKKFPAGTLLIALYGATIGKTALLGVEATTNQAICGIFENDYFHSKFLHNYLRFRKPKLVAQGSGGAQPNISQTILKKLKIPLAPLPEQRAIVAKIEALFSDLDSGVADLKTAQAQLKIYRQAVLKKAFEGEWETTQIKNLCEVVRGGSPRPAGDEKYYNGEIPFLKVADLTRSNGAFLETHTFSIKPAGLKKTRLVAPNTLLLSNSGATLGVPKICAFETTFNDGIAAFLGLDEQSLLFHYYFWMSKTKELRNINQGAAQPNLNTRIIGDTKIPLCSLEEQQQIVREIEARLSVCDEVESTLFQSLEKAEALRQSILKKAFEGRLLSAAELEACRAEPDWEPASVLLEKIKTTNFH
ncbi:restriction endonuclease subunit S [Pontiellaceae bacterium B12227]|nr:restriction endonuclease subunit S [Pontiellaceae bacterium B12227]